MDFDNTELAIDSPAELIPATPAGATLELAEQRYSSVIDGVVAYISSIDLSPAIVEEAATFLVTSKDDLAEAAILRTRLLRPPAARVESHSLMSAQQLKAHLKCTWHYPGLNVEQHNLELALWKLRAGQKRNLRRCAAGTLKHRVT